MTVLKTWFVSLLILFCGTVLTSLLSSCSAPLPAAEGLSPVERAQATINEANIDITAAAQTIAQSYKDGLLSDADRRDRVAKLKQAANGVDQAQSLLRAGDVSGAQNRAEAQRAAIRALRAELNRYLKEHAK